MKQDHQRDRDQRIACRLFVTGFENGRVLVELVERAGHFVGRNDGFQLPDELPLVLMVPEVFRGIHLHQVLARHPNEVFAQCRRQVAGAQRLGGVLRLDVLERLVQVCKESLLEPGELHGDLWLAAKHGDAEFDDHSLQGHQLAGQGRVAVAHQDGRQIQVARQVVERGAQRLDPDRAPIHRREAHARQAVFDGADQFQLPALVFRNVARHRLHACYARQPLEPFLIIPRLGRRIGNDFAVEGGGAGRFDQRLLVNDRRQRLALHVEQVVVEPDAGKLGSGGGAQQERHRQDRPRVPQPEDFDLQPSLAGWARCDGRADSVARA